MIELRKITKSFGGKPVLSELDLQFYEGGDYCVAGASGVGKTTLLHMLMGITLPDSGVVCGVREHKIAPVFQDDRLCMHLSVGANIRLAARERVSAPEIDMVLDCLLLPKSQRQPVKELSGGMKRRVCIARAMLSGGSLWLFDEPYSALDSDTKRRVMDEVRTRRGGKTMIWVTHDLSDAEYMGSEIITLQ